MIAKPISIKGTGCKFGGCVRKAVELTSGDLPFVPESGLRMERSILTGRQKSAAGVVVRQRMKAQTVLRKCNGSRSFPPRFSHYCLASFAVWLWASAVSRRDQAAGEFGAPFGRSSRLNAQGLRSETSP